MCLNFYPVWTQDGSIRLFNEEVDDIYHSSYGAYNESLEKFIYPSSLTEKAKNNLKIKILDICYGMGYNTKCAIEKIRQNNFGCEFFVDALEMDANVVAFSLLCKKVHFDFSILDFVDFSLLNNPYIIDAVFEIIKNKKFLDFIDEEMIDFFEINKNELYKYSSEGKINPCLHNIYYKYISARNIKGDARVEKRPLGRLQIHLGDARYTCAALEGNYDLIFLDAFTPVKLPTLWSVEFFQKLKILLKPDGNITTYSNSAAIRSGMKEAGLFIGKTQYGTIAFKDESLLKMPLDEKSFGLMGTKAGIPFFDKDLNSSKEEILAIRQKLIDVSKKQSASQFLKNYQNKK